MRLQGQGSGGHLLDQRDRQQYVQYIRFKEQTMVPKGRCFHVFLVCGATYLCAIREWEAGLSALEMGAILQQHGLSPIALLGTSPLGDGYVSVWREAGAILEVWPSCLVPVPTNGYEETGAKQNPCLWAVLSLFNHESICSGAFPVLPERDRTKQEPGYMTIDESATGLMARLPWEWC